MFGKLTTFSAAGVIVALVLAAPSFAVVPTLISTSQSERHPAVTFSAPKADYVSVYVASKPNRATDGRFLEENVVTADSMTDSEIQTGNWAYEYQLDPGRYFVMIQASPDFDSCYVYGAGTYDPSCADGFSTVATLDIPTPAPHYVASAKTYKWLNEVRLNLKVTPLGTKAPYKVCYALKTKKRRCLTGVVDGYGWNSSADDELTVRKRGLGKRTTFTWFVAGRKIAARTVRTA
ncbi:MAG: hypothetical protein WBQ14_06475 [Gaiellaceae bacterium]